MISLYLPKQSLSLKLYIFLQLYEIRFYNPIDHGIFYNPIDHGIFIFIY